MGKRRSDNPMTILVIGIMMIVGFGGCLVYMTDKTPILRLRPLVQQKFDLDSLGARFRAGRPGSPAAVVLEFDSGEDFPAERDVELADWALRKYIDLALESKVGRTSVAQVEIRVEGAEQPRFVLRRLHLGFLDDATKQKESLVRGLQRYGLTQVELEVAGYTPTGVELKAKATARARIRTRAGRRALALLVSKPYTGRASIELSGEPPLVLRGGRDLPAQTAPVTSR